MRMPRATRPSPASRGGCCRCSGEEDIARVACEELRRLFDCNAMLVSGLPAPAIVAAAPERQSS